MTADPKTLAAAWLARFTGSATPGQYVHPTRLEQLDGDVEAGWAVANALGLTVPVIASPAPGPYLGDDTVAHALADQVTAAYPGAASTAKARTGLQRWQQLVALEQAVAAALGGASGGGAAAGTIPAGESQGTRLWQPEHDPTFATATGVIAAGYSRTQFESADMAIHEGTVEVAVENTPWGRAAKYTIPGRTVRAEAMPPQNLLNDHSTGVLYLGDWFALDDSFPRNPRKGWSVITQLHGNDTTSPRFDLQINSGELRVGDNTTICPVVPHQRYDWVMRCDLDRGLVTVWVGGVKRLDSYHCGTSRAPYYLKQGFYHSADDSGGTIWQGPLRVGTGYGAVAPAA